MEQAKVSQSPINSLRKQGVLEIVNASTLTIQEKDLFFFPPEPKPLHPEQQDALSKITSSIKTSRFCTHLLYGITGSGKTEVYIRAIREARALGKSAILLVPEISLTIQTETLFKALFHQEVGILHHKLSDSDKNKVWREAAEGSIHIIIGPRSALFCPIKKSWAHHCR